MRNFLYLLTLISLTYSFSAKSAGDAIKNYVENSGSLRGVAISRASCNTLFNFEEIRKTAEIFAFLTNRDAPINDLNDVGELVPTQPANSFKKYLSQFNFPSEQVTLYVVREAEKAILFAMDVFDMALVQEQEKTSAMNDSDKIDYFNDSKELESMTHWLHLTMPRRPRNDYERILDRIRIMSSENYWHLYNLNVQLEHPETWSKETFALHGAFSCFDNSLAHEILRVCLQVLIENTSTFWETLLSAITQYQSVTFDIRNVEKVLDLHPIFTEKFGLIDFGSKYVDYVLGIWTVINGLGKSENSRVRFRSPELFEQIKKLSPFEIVALFPPQKTEPFSNLVKVLVEIRKTIFEARTSIIHYIKFAESLKKDPESSLGISHAIQERADLLEQGILDANHTLDHFKGELEKLRQEKAKLEEQASKKLEEERAHAESEALQGRIRELQAQEEAKEKALRDAEAELERLNAEQARLKEEAAKRTRAWKEKVAAYRSKSGAGTATGGSEAVALSTVGLDDFLMDAPPIKRSFPRSEQTLVNSIFELIPVHYEKMIALFRSLGFQVTETETGHKVSISGANPKMKSFHRPHPGTYMEDFRGLKAARELLAFAGYTK
ncbi:MAG: hypothetical protein FJX18_02160 [Alphaproteobacteria bacterium]|nr:hypothetical protein [Alphaproteobacteria bacterium]